jgi:hypothetical protein
MKTAVPATMHPTKVSLMPTPFRPALGSDND